MPFEQTINNSEHEKDLLSPERRSFNDAEKTFLLDLKKDDVDLEALKETAEKNGLEPKDEFHITVLGFKHISQIRRALESLPKEEKQEKISKMRELAQKIDWHFALKPEKYHISKEYVFRDRITGEKIKEKRESYVQMVSLPAMKEFYTGLNEILGTELEPPPAHITLFTGGENKEKAKMGIGINSEAEFQSLNPEPII